MNPIIGDRYEHQLVKLKERIEQVKQLTSLTMSQEKARASSQLKRMGTLRALEDEVRSAAKESGLKVNVDALKKPNYFAERRKSTEGPRKTEQVTASQKNRSILKDIFRKKQVAQPYAHPELDVLPLAKLEEQSRIEFNEKKLDAKIRDYYSEFVARKI